jgi:hypothetical protein
LVALRDANCITEGRESAAAPGRAAPKRGRLVSQDDTYRPPCWIVGPGAPQASIVVTCVARSHTNDHPHDGHPSVLVRLEAVDATELAELLEEA